MGPDTQIARSHTNDLRPICQSQTECIDSNSCEEQGGVEARAWKDDQRCCCAFERRAH